MFDCRRAALRCAVPSSLLVSESIVVSVAVVHVDDDEFVDAVCSLAITEIEFIFRRAVVVLNQQVRAMPACLSASRSIS